MKTDWTLVRPRGTRTRSRAGRQPERRGLGHRSEPTRSEPEREERSAGRGRESLNLGLLPLLAYNTRSRSETEGLASDLDLQTTYGVYGG
jgi:hypothetical protein